VYSQATTIERIMTGISAQDDSSFRRILARNITMPLVAGVINVGVFAGILVYLLSVLTWVEHSERVIGNANETAKLMVDQESGLRGFALTGDETFLASYKLAKPKMDTGLATLRELVADNPVQVTRVRNIEAQQRQWDGFAQSVIELRRKGGDYLEPIRAGRGKLEFDEVRNSSSPASSACWPSAAHTRAR
jgi:CHASE3 domain sensor protein